MEVGCSDKCVGNGEVRVVPAAGITTEGRGRGPGCWGLEVRGRFGAAIDDS